MRKFAYWSTATIPIMVVALSLTSLLIPKRAGAQQQPDIFANPKNLKVLPKDISSAELRSTMRSFALGLGVRCSHCHQGEEGKPLSTYDFPSDEKETKRIARKMLKMEREINETVTDLDRGDDHKYVEVNCVTCHRGQDRPRLIGQVLGDTYAESDGEVAAVISKYRSLREQYYGSHTFDFGVFPLNGFAFGLAKQEKYDDAITLFELNAEYHPDDVNVWTALGSTLEKSGDRMKAGSAYRRVLELVPDHRFASQRLAALEEKPDGE